MMKIARVDWLVSQRRDKLITMLRDQLLPPDFEAEWAVEQVLSGGDVIDRWAFSDIISSLAPDSIRTFMCRVLVPEKAVTGVAHGGDVDDDRMIGEHGYRRRYNAYLDLEQPLAGLTAADIESALAVVSAAALFRLHSLTLNNGTPVQYVQSEECSDLWLGSIQTFPFLQRECRDREPGLTRMYSILANIGYGYTGSQYHPLGYSLTCNLWILARPYELYFMAHDSPARAEKIGRSVAKRMNLDCFNQRAWQYLAEHQAELFASEARNPHTQARLWRLGALFGENHPLLSAVTGDTLNSPSWKLNDIRRLHRDLCRNRDTRLFAVGSLPADDLIEALDRSLGERKQYKSRPLAIDLDNRLLGVAGQIFRSGGEDHATVTLTFGAEKYGGDAGPAPAELRMIQHAVRDRLLASLGRLGPHRVSLWMEGLEIGDWFSAEISATCSPDSIGELLQTLRAGLESLVAAPLADVEVWRSCLRQNRILCAEDMRVGYVLDLLCSYARCGGGIVSPSDWMLVRDVKSLAKHAPVFFPADCYAYTVVTPGEPAVESRNETNEAGDQE
jgi:hypothetical protein